ncbi:MAG: site-2 protease family protein [Slackia sp.]|nr:site-2 protease family protein [Slackia sp.]
MDIVMMIVYLAIVLSILVFVHEGGHYLAARVFGVRVTEFMIGLPGPNIGFTWRGTRYGVTAIPLGGYAKVCGMEPGPENPHIERALAFSYERGTVYADDLATELGITVDEACEVLYVLEDWGCLVGPKKSDEHNIFRTRAYRNKKRGIDRAEGAPRAFSDAHELYLAERAQTYRALPFWKRSVILLAGVFVNLIVAIVLLVVAFSVIGVDIVDATGAVQQHIVLTPLESIQGGLNYIVLVAQAVAGLFNPQTAAQTVEGSTSIMGMAVMSKAYADAGLAMFLQFMAMISVSLGIMNLLPIPPLDGGRFVIEVFQKVSRKVVGCKAMNYMSIAGMVLFVGFFVIMLNQDIQRFVFGNW